LGFQLTGKQRALTFQNSLKQTQNQLHLEAEFNFTVMDFFCDWVVSPNFQLPNQILFHGTRVHHPNLLEINGAIPQ
jgi:hypothetical protein